MLTIFFVIVFIAELIVAEKIISTLKKTSATVCEINDQVSEIKPVVASSMHGVSSGVNSAAKGVETLTKFLEDKRRSLIVSLIKAALGIAVFLMIKKYPHKKWLSLVDVFFALGKLIRSA